MLAINEDRVLADLRALAEFGKAGTGVNRPAFSDADIEARRWLMAQMQSAGLETVIDGIGNVFGRSPDAAQSILVGSHSDSVPNGGWLDGALGVVYALEVARAARGARGAIGIDVISFADEEGTWLPLSRQQNLLRRRRRGYFARGAKKDRRTIGGSVDAA